jgi:ketosteroid isomerase-like protein
MKQLNMPAMISLLLVTVTGSASAQATADFESVHATSQSFVAAIRARDIEAMDKVWRHETYTSFIGPLSTTVVVGWEGVRKAWQMRFGQFDRVTISMNDPHVHINGDVAWVVGIEKVELLRKDGKTIGFDAFVTNVLEKKDSRWLMVAHQSTPVFKPPE